MFKESKAFSGFAVDDISTAKDFYRDVLGLDVEEGTMGLQLHIAGRQPIFIYQRQNHTPATYTILNFPVEDIDHAIDELSTKGVRFERYSNLPAPQDEKGVLRGKAAKHGPDIAWFKDPAGNILSVLSD